MKNIQEKRILSSTERGEELTQKLKLILDEISKEFVVAVCEIDDNNAVSKVVNVIFDDKDKRIYIEANYSL